MGLPVSAALDLPGTDMDRWLAAVSAWNGHVSETMRRATDGGKGSYERLHIALLELIARALGMF